MISASVSVATTGTPSITVSGANGGPSDGTIVHRLSLTGLALTTVTDSCTVAVVVSSGSNALTLEFNTGGATSATCTVNGFTL